MTPLLAIRIAMLGGVLLFGGVSWFLHRTPDWEPADAVAIDSLVTVGRFMWIGVILGLAALWFRSRSVTAASQASTFAIIAWSLGETLALYGGVLYFLSDLAGWYVAGVLSLAIAFVAFPGTPQA